MSTNYIDKVAPEHDRTSCNDINHYNAAFDNSESEGRSRCLRCTLLAAADSATTVTDEMVEQVTMTILGKEKDPVPGVNWRCPRFWYVDEVRALVRKSLFKFFGD